MLSKNRYSFTKSTHYRASYNGVDSIFSWTIFIFFLTGFALFCWMGSFYVFGHPEKPANYRLLKRLHKLEEPQRFEIGTVPRGEFFKPVQLLERFGHLEPNQLQQLNETLLRHFLRNYHQTHDLVPYAIGTYKIKALLPLTERKLFFPGVAVLLQAVDQPQVFLEQIFTTDAANLPALQATLAVGEEVTLEKPVDFAAIIFIDPLPQGGIKLTTMPLLYGNYKEESSSSFSLQPPTSLNIDAGLPLFTATEMLREQGASPTKENLPSQKKLISILDNQEKKPKSPSSSKNRETTTSETSAATAPSVAAAIPVNVPSVLPAIAVNGSPRSVLPTNTTPTSPNAISATESNTLPATPAASENKKTDTLSFSNTASTVEAFPPVSSLPTGSPTNVPSFSSNPTVNAPNGWLLYEAGKMPRGRVIAPSEISSLAEQGVAGERLYLQGEFVVTASGLDRSVLRYQAASSGLPLSRVGKIRIIAVFPTGSTPPAEGASITRDNLHPLMITDVKKEGDGTINLYVREITSQQQTTLVKGEE